MSMTVTVLAPSSRDEVARDLAAHLPCPADDDLHGRGFRSKARARTSGAPATFGANVAKVEAIIGGMPSGVGFGLLGAVAAARRR